MLLADTDILMCKIETENIYEEFYKDKQLLDFSNYQKNPRYYDDSNNLVVVGMKYETFGVPIICFAGSKFKLYTIKTEDNLVSTKANGAGKDVVADELKFEDYKNVLLNRSNET